MSQEQHSGHIWSILAAERDYLIDVARWLPACTQLGVPPEDVVHSTLLRGYKKFGSLKARGSVRPWLRTILINTSSAAVRKHRTESEYRDAFAANFGSRTSEVPPPCPTDLKMPRLLEDLKAERPGLEQYATAFFQKLSRQEMEALLGLDSHTLRRKQQAFQEFSLKWLLRERLHGARDSFEGVMPTVRACIAAFPELAKVVGFESAAAWMRQCSADAWVHFQDGRLPLEGAATAAAATAKVHQQCGRFDEAGRELDVAFRYVGRELIHRKLSTATADALLAVQLRLEDCKFGSGDCVRMLDAAMALKSRDAREKFRWRSALDAIARDDQEGAHAALEEYALNSGFEKIGGANIKLVGTFDALGRGEWEEAEEMTRGYRRMQVEAWNDLRSSIPDPGVHGVITGIYLQAEVHRRTARTGDAKHELAEFLFDLSRFRCQAGIGAASDGMREASAMLDILWPIPGSSAEPVTGRRSWEPPRNHKQAVRVAAFANRLDGILSSVK